MPETLFSQIGLLATALVAGLLVGWLVRGRRCLGEKAAINAGWREQMAARRSENERLVEQNTSLMQQNSQYRAAEKDSQLRAAELSSALKEVFERRDELQQQIKEIRGNLEAAVRERDRLQSHVEHRGTPAGATSTAIGQRDEKIALLSKELKNWQERVSPLIERFRMRNQEVLELEEQLARARQRIGALETRLGTASAGSGTDPSGEDPPAADESSGPTGHVDAPLAGSAAAADPGGDVEAAWTDVPGASEADIGGESTIDNGFGRDDLKRIKGVGPAIEKTLNEMGIWRFNQIADMSEYEMDRVAQRLKGFRSRIYREDWIGQARELEERKSGGRD